MAFVRSSYSSLKATLAAEGTEFSATLRTIDSVRVADGADFDAAGNLKKGRRALSPQDAVGLAQGLSGADFSVAVSSPSHTPASRTPRSAPQPCNRKPATNSDLGLDGQ